MIVRFWPLQIVFDQTALRNVRSQNFWSNAVEPTNGHKNLSNIISACEIPLFSVLLICYLQDNDKNIVFDLLRLAPLKHLSHH